MRYAAEMLIKHGAKPSALLVLRLHAGCFISWKALPKGVYEAFQGY